MHPHPACVVLLAILLPVPTARADRLAPGSAGAVTVHAADGGTADFAPEITVLF